MSQFVFAIAVLFASIGFGDQTCESLFDPSKRPTIEVRDPSRFNCILSALGCGRSVRIPLGSRFGPVILTKSFFRNFQTAISSLWSLHEREGIREINLYSYGSPDLDHRVIGPAISDLLGTKQIVAPLREIDKILLRESLPEANPREVGITQIYNKSGQIIYKSRELEYGNSFSVGTTEFTIAEVSEQVKFLGSDVELVELIHTHPYPELRIELEKSKGQRNKVIMHSLSKEDIEFVVAISQAFPGIFIAVTAVTPTGRRYTAVFLNGLNISESFLGSSLLK